MIKYNSKLDVVLEIGIKTSGRERGKEMIVGGERTSRRREKWSAREKKFYYFSGVDE